LLIQPKKTANIFWFIIKPMTIEASRLKCRLNPNSTLAISLYKTSPLNHKMEINSGKVFLRRKSYIFLIISMITILFLVILLKINVTLVKVVLS